ncbi:MAG: hypothetical protein FJ026_13845 [Chloroflexi bacterium]|nr:hypothetical protein [Chloroflexota bacterium]
MAEENEEAIRSLIVQYLVHHTQCVACGRSYTTADVEIHDHRGDVWLAAVTCRHCGLQGLVMASVRTKDVRALTDGASTIDQEAAVLQRLGPISADEVLDFHRFLERFRGDMKELLH